MTNDQEEATSDTKNNIKVDLEEILCKGGAWNELVQDRI